MTIEKRKPSAPGTDRAIRTTLPCPHCQSALRIRSNREISSISRDLFMFCTNMEECGATFRGILMLQHQVSPSGCANPRVPLGMVPPRRRAANDDQVRGPEVPPVANDDHPLGEALG